MAKRADTAQAQRSSFGRSLARLTSASSSSSRKEIRKTRSRSESEVSVSRRLSIISPTVRKLGAPAIPGDTTSLPATAPVTPERRPSPTMSDEPTLVQPAARGSVASARLAMAHPPPRRPLPTDNMLFISNLFVQQETGTQSGFRAMLPENWTKEHDRFIAKLDAQGDIKGKQASLVNIIGKLQRRFPELQRVTITQGLIERRLQILDANPELGYWREALTRIDEDKTDARVLAQVKRFSGGSGKASLSARDKNDEGIEAAIKNAEAAVAAAKSAKGKEKAEAGQEPGPIRKENVASSSCDAAGNRTSRFYEVGPS